MKKVFLVLSAVAWVASAAVTVAQQKTTPAKPVTAPTSAPASTSSPAPEKTKAEQTATERLEKFAGTVERVDGAGKLFVVKGRKDAITFTVDDRTKIIRGGKEMPFSDLKKEMGVAVDYKTEGDRKTAVSIRVAAPKAVPREKTPETPAEAPRK
jgi:hypothetical protein